MSWRVFLSYASEDRATFVSPLKEQLAMLGLQVWHDTDDLRLGDSFLLEMRRALRQAEFLVAVMSPHYFEKHWTQLEALAGLESERADGRTKILPVLLNVSHLEATRRFPDLAGRVCAFATEGVVRVARRIYAAICDDPGIRTARRGRLHGVLRDHNSFFRGRASAVAETVTALVDGRDVALTGMPGIGKTEVALQTLRALADRGAFPGGIFWLDASRPDLTASWAAMQESSGIEADSIDERARRVLRHIENQPDDSLVVLDGVTSWTGDERPFPLPRALAARFLLTTSVRRLGRNLVSFEIGPLGATEAEGLLCEVSGREPGEEGLAELLGHLSGHPLAIHLTAAYLSASPEVSPAKLLDELRASSRIVDVLEEGDGGEATIADAFGATWSRADEALRSAWRRAATFGTQFVSIELSDAAGLGDAERCRLRDRHLIETTRAGWWRMHPLGASFARERVPDDGRKPMLSDVLRGMEARAEALARAGRFREFAAEWSHFERALEQARSFWSETAPRLWRFRENAVDLLHAAGDLKAAACLLEGAVRSGASVLDPQSRELRAARSDLGLLRKELGDLRGARILFEDLLRLEEGMIDPGELVLAETRGRLALVLRRLGDLEGARALLELVLADESASLPDGHARLATTRANLALVLQDQEDLPAARRELEAALASDLERLPSDHPTVALRRANLASVLEEMDELDGARALLEAALEADDRRGAEDHPDVALRRSLLGVVQRRQDDLESAQQSLESALRSMIDRVGEDHLGTASIRANLALVRRDLGDRDSARALMRAALAVARTHAADTTLRRRIEQIAPLVEDRQPAEGRKGTQ